MKDKPFEDWSDGELVRACLGTESRSSRPYYYLVRRYEGLVRNICLRYFTNQEIAEEITQDAFLKAYNKLDHLEKPERFKSWTAKITYNMCADRYGKIKRRREMADKLAKEQQLDFQDSPEDQIETRQSIQHLMECLKELNELSRDIIMMHYISDLKVREISETTELRESAVKMRLSRIREKLLVCIKKKM